MRRITSTLPKVSWAAGLALLGLGSLTAGSPRPNILFIAVDDLKPAIRSFGDDFAITPNIDRLAKNGTVFRNNHCQQAVCGPSRASIMTGLRPDSLGIWFFGQRMRELRSDILTLPEFFKNQGYATTAIGKIFDPRNVNDRVDPESWNIPHKAKEDHIFSSDFPEPTRGHYQSLKTRQAFAEAEAMGMTDFNDIFKYLRTKEANPAIERLEYDVPDNAYTDGAMALGAVEILKEFKHRGTPFFLGVGFWKPHLAFTAPKRYWDMYDRSKISINPYQHKTSDPVDIAYHQNEELRGYFGIPPEFDSYSDDPADHLPMETQIDLIHGYYAATSYVDAQVGRLLDALDELGLAENTIVVLWGDHGFQLGDHGMWHKQSNFEQATRSPLVIRAPDLGRQDVLTAPTEFIDVFPTLCELTGFAVPSGLEGTSLVPLMTGATTSVKPFAVSQYPRGNVMGYTIRSERYRYTEWIDSWRTDEPYEPDRVRGRELYDYQLDPRETRNLAADPGSSEILRGMQDLMHGFFRTSLESARRRKMP